MWGFASNDELVRHLIEEGYLKTPSIINAFRKVDRVNFVPQSQKDAAYVNAPLPIGEGQTISQPLTVAFMIELLAPKRGDKVLDIGAGSGWVSAILSEIVGPEGWVYSFEIIPQVGRFGMKNIEKFGCKNVKYVIGDFYEYFQENAPYDKIISGAAFSKIPQKLIGALVDGGVLVTPTQSGDVRRLIRKGRKVEEEIYPGFAFVPITGKLSKQNNL